LCDVVISISNYSCAFVAAALVTAVAATVARVAATFGMANWSPSSSPPLPPTFTAAPVGSSFTDFHKVTVDDVFFAICRLPDKSCVADTLPTPQLKLVADLIAPFLTEIFNRSLSTTTVPTVFKSALITLLIKKPDLDSTDPRPISNL